ncbi:hypothetical protein HDV57DRAFT_17449 [Trichoderma longibrachiatum]|uniref:Cell wall proline rich protein n=1 Tax=Trichoderma longibrachiatum ATCC 18648 TaxID=983965 RepID=A0A2T4CJ04_TRILO|nr:hypothetical protein M440DRAFT_1018055 [Trichoderma longibrachiatum ATCC 18648]
MMATALYTPERAAVAPPVHNMEGAVDYLASLDDATTASLARGPASQHGALPPPNPQFSFPAAPPTPSHDSIAKRRRPMSAVEMHRPLSIAVDGSRHAALPAFSFNPGASLPPDPRAFLSPPHSPNSAKQTPGSASTNRPMGHGHRRGGSEFVGGRLREGSTIAVMSTSPPKNEFDLKTPNLQPPRRGHRRGMSATIPATDLPMLFAPPAIGSLPQGNSAPSSPTIVGRKEDLPLIGFEFPLPEPTEPGKDNKSAGSSKAPLLAPDEAWKMGKPMLRSKVGFSDTLEFIPRPLSLVSNDTSSTITARPGHSVSGSVSSVISVTSNNGRDGSAPLSRTASEPQESRPSTAGAILERTAELQITEEPPTSPRRRNSIPALLNISDADATESNVSTPSKPAKRWSFFGLDAFASGSPVKRRPSSSGSSECAPRPVDRISCSDRASESSLDTSETPSSKHKKGSQKGDKKKKKSKKEKKEEKKEKERKKEEEKKAKGWAGSILPLKGHKKRGKSSAVRPPTPPASVSHPDDDEEDETERDIREPSFEPPTISITESPPLPEPSEPPKRHSEEISSPIIDLDAALGPFNTPLSYNPEWEAAQRAAGTPSSRRRLHSAQGLKGFSGPGMHYHRRAESAPDLPPFDFRSSMHRFGSSSTMADVFEEDEEDDDGKGHPRTRLETSEETSEESDGETTPPAVVPVSKEAFGAPSDRALGKMRRRSAGIMERESLSSQAARADAFKISLQDETIAEEFSLPIFRAPTFQGRRDSVDSGAPSAPSPRQLPVTIDMPVDEQPLALPSAGISPLSPYSASYASSPHPSPRTPMSIDAQRISTAPSSVTDDSFHSLLMGEPGPEVRISMDYDVPSIASSTSAMTRDSTYIPAPRPRQPLARDQRPVSMSAPFGRRRSSLASLSRLISSSHGERSKLSMEVTLDNEPESKKSKSKTKRLGRMMQFWKPNKDEKDKAT